MLFTQAARDLRDTVEDRWGKLRAWLDRPTNATANAAVRKPIDYLYKHWQDVDRGLLSDPDEIDGAHGDLETAETYAVEKGYPPPTGYHGPRPSTEDLHPFVATAGAVDTAVRAVPALDHLTDPKRSPSDLCTDLGVPRFVCEGRAPGISDVPTWLWVLGGGVLISGAFAAYATYRAAPVVAPLLAEAYLPPEVRRALAEQRMRQIGDHHG